MSDRSIGRVVIGALVCAALLVGCNATGSPGAGSPSPSGAAAGTSASPSVAASAGAVQASASTSASASGAAPASASSSADGPFALSSRRIASGGRIPVEYTCDGAQVSPPLEWTGVPSGTIQVALIVDDPDANGFVHWVVYGIEPGTNLAQGVSRSAAAPREGLNSRGSVGWTGPCPPSGTHHYDFTLYALRRSVSFARPPTAAQLRAGMDGAIIVSARLVATYRRG